MIEINQYTGAIIEKLGEDFVEKFQRGFKDSIGAQMLGIILREEGDSWEDILTNMDSSDTRMRQAQGGLEAINRVVKIISQLLAYEKPEQVEEDEGREEDIEDGDTNVVY